MRRVSDAFAGGNERVVVDDDTDDDDSEEDKLSGEKRGRREWMTAVMYLLQILSRLVTI